MGKKVSEIILGFFLIIFMIIFTLFHPIHRTIHKIIGRTGLFFFRLYIDRNLHEANKLTNSEKYNDAINIYLKIIKKAPFGYKQMVPSFQIVMVNLGELYRITANYKKSEEILKEVISECPPGSYTSSIANMDLGSMYADLSKYKVAEKCMLEAYKYLSVNPNDENFRTVTHNLYGLYAEIGQNDKAMEYLRVYNDQTLINKTKRYIGIPGKSESPKNNSALNHALNLMAEARKLHGEMKFPEAEEKAKEAVSLLEEENPRTTEYAESLLILAEILFRRKKGDDSLLYAEKAKNIFENVFGPGHIQVLYCDSYIGLANSLLGKKELAEAQFNDTANSIRNILGRESIGYITMLSNLAHVYMDQNDSIRTEYTFLEIMEIYISLLQNYFFEMNVDERIALMDVLTVIQLGIFNYLVRDLHHSGEFIRKCFEFRLTVKWTLLESPRKLLERSSGFYELQGNLTENEAIIEVVRFIELPVTETRNSFYLFFVITRETIDAPLISVLRNGNELEKKYFDEYYTSIKRKSINFNSYSRYWHHLEPLLTGKSKCFISSNGVYRNINLNTLYTSGGSYLIDEKEFILCHDLRNIPDLKSATHTISKKAFLLGNPLFYDDDLINKDNSIAFYLPPLPSSGKEVDEIVQILQEAGWNSSIYKGDRATKESLKEIEDVSIIHLATHGSFSRIPLKSSKTIDLLSATGLFLSHSYILSDDDNGIKFNPESFFSGEDVIKMNLQNVELVVLSACESGVGIQLKQGETFGFQRAFFLAGAKTLIMSLWDVTDEVTFKMMTTFYGNFMKSGDKEASFKIALQSIKSQQKYRHPYYWGGFVMIQR